MLLSIAEEEASKLRFYVDQPAYMDLHWVSSVLYLAVVYSSLLHFHVFKILSFMR